MNLNTKKEKVEFLEKFRQGIVDETDLLGERFGITLNLSGKYLIDGKEVSQAEYIDYAEMESSSKKYIITLKT